ncbi:TolB family protein [Planctomyces sp. SH-PL62]|uniref:TolB family protein n=1 Tax=Planctomyces sp. SH-PL62 TaxID=1636152 RepID=UPI00078C78BC|nr:PD40 domain-containing protein [Planctomyces sp. SH-PL62]AMV40417.1 translocation protein TolB [Planctomyces sp. SH-PL62]
MRGFAWFAALLTVAFVAGCDRGEDDWGRFLETGRYEGGSPSISPTTGRIVFSSPRSGRGDLYVCGEGIEDPVPLTRDPAFENQPLFSPDGKTIVYAKQVGGWTHLWSMSSEGANPRPLTSGAFLDSPREFSADGSFLYFVRVSPSTGLARSADWWRIDADGKNLQKLPPGAPIPTTLQQGPLVVDLTSFRGGQEASRELSVGSSVDPPPPHASQSQPRLSYDRKKLAFAVNPPGGLDVEVYELDLDTGAVFRRH